jgi:LmbE family N-acetylglucosaminyl deacetylase
MGYKEEVSKMSDVLVIAAHPDDETACGGLLLKVTNLGYKIKLLYVTNGQSGSFGEIKSNAKNADERAKELGRIRIKEVTEAAKILGDDNPIFLNEVDGCVENPTKLRNQIASAIRINKPKLLISPFVEDIHPDHVAVSLATREAIFTARTNVAGLEGEPYGVPNHIEMVLEPMSTNILYSLVIDISDVWDQKQSAIECHRTQLKSLEHYRKLDDLIAQKFAIKHGEIFKIRFVLFTNLLPFLNERV